MKPNVRMQGILNLIDQLITLQDQIFETSDVIMQAYHDGSVDMARTIRKYVSDDMKNWNELREEEAEEDARLDRIAEDKENERFSDDESSY